MAMCLPSSAAAPSVLQLDLGITKKKQQEVLRDWADEDFKGSLLGQLLPLTLALCFIAASLPRRRLDQLLPAVARAILAPFGAFGAFGLTAGTGTLHHGDSGEPTLSVHLNRQRAQRTSRNWGSMHDHSYQMTWKNYV